MTSTNLKKCTLCFLVAISSLNISLCFTTPALKIAGFKSPSKIHMSAVNGFPDFDESTEDLTPRQVSHLADGTPFERGADGTIIPIENVPKFHKPIQNPALITFDATNTLIRLKAPVGAFYRSTLLKHFRYRVRLPNFEEFNEAFHAALEERMEEQPCYGIGQGVSSFDWWSAVVKESYYKIGRKFGIPKVWIDQVLPAMQDELYNEIFRSPLAWEARPDSRLMLDGLKEWRDHNNGPKLGIVTNFDERLTDVLKSLDLLRYFDFIVTSREVGVAKPAQQIFDIALTRAGLYDSSLAVHVGDDMIDDIEASLNAGWGAIWVRSATSEMSCDDEAYTRLKFSECYRLRSVLDKFGIEYESFGESIAQRMLHPDEFDE
mmetsp:Transcript_1810/g.2469  ORF Transcript_1810/g.2469 Transcript_1810/m.2469 type:complete len:376 (+) Transcript_1810:132-1259(+)|eukprot:CAMPEP_0117746388 /NCGR_PEP_ID=MMETSP0947-20121206/7917_1 /TAXON_ID=44440 /ORGANISM="Chattonella subsalsa, Strain CCMP2191" /LENGTH=375 /DNA_ID=CAMNT_0005563703 /DNA_START=81 /DNA_END=1208 /DNA_ORIENTATION=+